MAKENVSPEERLFKVIQKGKDTPLERKDLGKNKTAGTGFRGTKHLFSGLGSAGKGIFARAKSGSCSKETMAAMPAGLPIRLNEISPRAINGVLLIMLGVLTAVTIHYGINKRPSIAKLSSAISKIHFQTPKREPVEAFKPVDFYLKEVRKRDIFKPAPKVQKKDVIPKPKQVLNELKEKAKDLKLKGISWGTTPKAMVKNDKEDKMYFLKEGQMIGATGIKIKAVFKDKVLIGCQGEEMELL